MQNPISVELSEEVRDTVANSLQAVLADLIDLALLGKQAHWNVVGPLFGPVHTQLDTLVDDARVWYDDVAERKVAIGVAADGQVADITSQSSLRPLPKGAIDDSSAVAMMADRVAAVTYRARRAISELDDLDLVSQDLLIEVARGLEKHLWMLRAQTESAANS